MSTIAFPFPSPLTRLGKVCKALESLGPMTAVQLSEITGLNAPNVREVITRAREKNVWNLRIRKIGLIREGKTSRSYVFELSNAPDVKNSPGVNKRKVADITERIREKRRIAQLAAQSQPFRDPMLFLTAGVSP